MNINECVRGSALCHPNAVCEDTDGSYTCECKAGFSGDGRVCTDDDECAAGDDNCLKEHASCVTPTAASSAAATAATRATA